MIPISISFEAFGPYAQRQEVDFSSLMHAGLVLIHGETGAGKTVLLDAMTYALYGRSSGGTRGEFTAMRCLSAPDSAVTNVAYTFDVRGKRYRFTRSLRVRRKRTGAVEYMPEQNVFFLDENGDFAPFFENPRIRDVEAKAQELIGLTYEQFCQVMILPQGQFERLLVAKSDEKETVLVSLFHAERWQKAAEYICAQANTLRQKLETEQAAIQAALSGYGCESADELAEQFEKTGVQLTEQVRACEDAGQALTYGRKLLEDAEQLAADFDKRDQAMQEDAVLNARQPDMDSLTARLKAARESAKLVPLQERKLTLEQEEKTRAEKAACAAGKLARSEAGLEGARTYLDAINAQAEQIDGQRNEQMRLQTLRDSYRRLDGARRAAQGAETAWKTAVQAVEKNEHARGTYAGERGQIAAKREEIISCFTTRLPCLRERLSVLKQARTLAEKRKRLTQSLEEAQTEAQKQETRCVECKRVLTDAQTHMRVLNQAYLTDAAAALAARLTEGDECPVCGSVHHPAVNRSFTSGVTGERLEEARKAEEQAHGVLAACEVRRAGYVATAAALREELAALEEEHGRLPDADETALRQAEQEVRRAQEQDAQLPRLAAQLQAAEAALALADAQTKPLAGRLSDALAEREHTAAAYAALSEQRTDGIADLSTLDEKLRVLKSSCESYAAARQKAEQTFSDWKQEQSGSKASLEHLQEELAHARQMFDAINADFISGLAAGGFADEKAFLASVMSSEKISEAERTLADYHAHRALARERLLVFCERLSGKTRPDIAQARKTVEEAEKRKAEMDSALGALSQEFTRMRECMERVQAAQSKLAQKRTHYEKYSAFGKLLRGDSGVSLRRYVLGVMLSSITAEANRLLQNVHGGRYQLYRTLEGTGRSRKAGLDLEVLDAHSGKRRGVASLSGGEKFLVSLSLALGLSAVVQAQSGGIRMEAMFIDEGFGSLDPDSITDALDVLASVKGSRRLVGIISHVEALSESIPTSIEVLKDRQGSHLLIHT